MSYLHSCGQQLGKSMRNRAGPWTWQPRKVITCLALGVKEKELLPEPRALSPVVSRRSSQPAAALPGHLSSLSRHLSSCWVPALAKPNPKPENRGAFGVHLHPPPGQGAGPRRRDQKAPQALPLREPSHHLSEEGWLLLWSRHTVSTNGSRITVLPT